MASRYKNNISLHILPDLIAEIDAMKHKPSLSKRVEMLARYKEEEAERQEA